MAIEGVDYSFTRPSPTCLRREGKEFAVRYTSVGTSPKNMTAPEVQSLIRAGLAVVTVHQEGVGDPLDGYSAGKSHAQWARAIAGPCGMPTGRPVYFTLDQDSRAFSQAQWRACSEFLDGAASVLGRSNVGIYGSYMTIERLVPGWAQWGWQTYAWSAGARSEKAVLYQYHNGVQLCGGAVDFDRAYKDDYGQWGIGNMALTANEYDEIEKRVERAVDHVMSLGLTGDREGAIRSWALPVVKAADVINGDGFAEKIANAILVNLPHGVLDIEMVVGAVKRALREGTEL